MNRQQVLQLLTENNLNYIPILPKSKKPLLDSWLPYQEKKFVGIIPPNANLGVICGRTSENLVVIDVDSLQLIESFKEFQSKTLVVQTKDGIHIYFKVRGELPKSLRLSNSNGQHIDVQSHGTYVLAPSSIHPDDVEYKIISDVTSVMQISFDQIQSKLNQLGFKVQKKPISKIIKGNLKEGERHSSAISYANYLVFRVGLDHNAMKHELYRWNETNKPPLPQHELNQIIIDTTQHHDRNKQDENDDPKDQFVDETISNLSFPEYMAKLHNEKSRFRKIIENHFPNRSFALEVALSIKAQMEIEGISQPFFLIFMGGPSTLKSTILEIVNSLPNCLLSDHFTPRAFVSHSANVKKKDLEKIDLLPRIKHKTLITPELAILFSGNLDELVEHFGMLTRILDGRGFQSDTGAHGRRGYSGDYYFTWIGAVIDIPHRVWHLLGNLGPKIYFYRLPEDAKIGKEKLDQIKKMLKDDSYLVKLKSSQDVIKDLWQFIVNRPGKVNGKIIWDKNKDDEETLERIIQISMLLAKLRGTMPTWQTRDPDSGGSMYNFETPIIEDPSRASSAFYNIARGHAVICGRNYITKEDLSVVIPTALSSAPKERVDLFRLLIENDGKLNTRQFIEYAKVSRATSLKEMERLYHLGLVDKTEEEGTTKPIKAIQLKEQFSWFLSPEFRQFHDEFRSSLIPQMSKLSHDYDGENLNKKGSHDGLNAFFED